MKKLISLLLTVGIMSTLFVACAVEDKVVITDEYDYNEMLTQTRAEIFDTLEITENDVGTLAQGEMVLLPENFVKSYLGYDFDVMLIFTSTDDDAPLIKVKYYIDYSGDPESALATSDDLYNKMSAIYGNTYIENFDDFIDKNTSIAINSTLDIDANWDLDDEDIEEKLGEIYAEVYGYSAEVLEQAAFTSKLSLHSNSGGEIINVSILNYLFYTP